MAESVLERPRRAVVRKPRSFLERWLRPELPQADGELRLHVFRDEGPLEGEDLYQSLGKEIFRNYVAPGDLEAVFEDLGAPEVAAHLRRNKYPSDLKVRVGEFGEVLTGRLLRDDRWCVPLLKLRYKQRPNQPVQGADSIGFRLQESPPVVMVPEAKTRTTRRLAIGVEAHTSLERSLRDLPETISFVVAALNREGKKGLAVRVGRLLLNPYEVERQIILVHDEQRWSDKITLRLGAVVSDRTKVTILRIADLARVVENAFRSATGVPAAKPAEESKSA